MKEAGGTNLRAAASQLQGRAKALEDGMNHLIVKVEKDFGVKACGLKARAWEVGTELPSTRAGEAGCELNIAVVPRGWVNRTYFLEEGELEKDFEQSCRAKRKASDFDTLGKAREVLLEGLGRLLCDFVTETGIGIRSVSARSRERRDICGDPLDDRACDVSVVFDLADSDSGDVDDDNLGD